MPANRPDKPSRTVQLDTGMAMTLSCSPARDSEPSPVRLDQAASGQQRGTAK